MEDVDNHVIKYFPLPGGKLPEYGESEARGYDIFCPYLIWGKEMDPNAPYQRKRLWTFCNPDKMSVQLPDHIRNNIQFRAVDGKEHKEWVYVLPPRHGHAVSEISIGFGIIFGMTKGWSAEICHRSGEASRKILPHTRPEKIMSPIADMPNIADWYMGVPIDSGFRGEPMTTLQNWGDEEFVISRHKRITQIKFTGPNGNYYPLFDAVESVAELGTSERMFGSHNSTGVNGVKKKTQLIQTMHV